MAEITYYSLSDYNNGELIPFTIENVELQTCEEHHDEIHENLERITKEKNDGVTREEWIVADYEDIPEEFVDTWSIESNYWDMVEAMNDSHLDEDVFMAGVALDIPFDRIEDAYRGKFDSWEDFAWDELEMNGTWAEIPETLQRYFDIEAYARDLSHEYNEENDHFFLSNW